VETLIVLVLGGALAWALLATAQLARLRRARERADAGGRDAEATAADARARADALLDSLPSVVLRVDAAARIVQVGRRAGERFGFLEPGMGILGAFGEHRLAGGVERAVAEMAPMDFEVRLFADGRRTYRALVRPYAVGASREALVVLMDVSEAVAYQELRSQFVANVSHELRTPLTGLRGLLEALDDPSMDEQTRASFVARCVSETQRLEALIADILFLSELEATQGLPPDDVCDLADAVEAVAADLADEAAAHGVEVIVRASGAAVCPLSDRMALTVARNLIENAIKYAGPGAVATVSVAIESGQVVLQVADDGAGIPERHLPHVFERFYRADPSRSKRMGGTGLGLSIVKHIAERFGGTVEARSREGFGTTVIVRLPSAVPPGGAVARGRSAAA
jgi:two-component system, OmpR family, phosphate regulon sensor histidine kinase PhoR